MLGPAPVHRPDIVLEGLSDASIMKDDDIAMEAVATDTSAAVVPPPPGYREFSWLRDDWMVGSDLSSNTTVEVFPGGSPPQDCGTARSGYSLEWFRLGRSVRAFLQSCGVGDCLWTLGRLSVRMCRALRWIPACSMRQGVD